MPIDPLYQHIWPAYVHPLMWVRNAVYSDMDAFADVVVEVPADSTTAAVHRREPASVRRPPWWLPWWRGAVLGVPTVVLLGAVEQIGPLGPGAAATWLALNWWLH